ncbi:hypothetical protein LY13_003608 [Prauserella aidingensis]|uniref:hypothetical protein n=1 Tax=Prauserella aidingensis TaxID=387890 RepID=UPI0020A540B5|nr:hypothetical protein [Prauserella aidingensis]MCP2254838.1 hypothetical protein [Prauserella aidingensis]
MTDEFRGNGGAADGSALSVDVLADLHAGALSESEAAELWPRVDADPEARAVIEALEAAQADLGSLRDEPVEPMPADVAARIDAAIADEQRTREQQAAGTNVVSLDRARSRRKKQGIAAGFVAVAAAVVAAVAIVVPNLGGGDETPGVAQPAPSEQSEQAGDGDAGAPSDGSGPLALSKDNGELASAAMNSIAGVRDYGPLETKSRLDACVQAAGADPSKDPAGVRPVTIDGQEAVLALYTTGKTAQFRMVAVSPDCTSAPVLDRVVGAGG